MRNLTALVALALCAMACASATPRGASATPRGEQVPLPTEPGAKLTGGGVLMNMVIDVKAHPVTGTPVIWSDQGGYSEMKWPEGFTAWRVGSEVEVLDTAGNRVLITGRRYKFHTSAHGITGYWVISDVKECPDCELGWHLE